MIFPRSIAMADIRARYRTDRIAISTPGDFRLGATRKLDPSKDAAGLLPYCIDFLRGRALYVGGVDAKDLQSAPFYYLHLRRNARTVVSVPWEHGALLAAPSHAPIFLFSPGRCGSTLLSRVLAGAEVPNVSEPDFLTQATTAVAASAMNPLRGTLRDVAAAMGADLCAVLDGTGPTVVKLRAESCRAPQLLVRPGERRTIYMTRGFSAWARSNGRAFRNGARKTVRKYLTAMSGYAWLKAHSDCHLVRYEDLIADAPSALSALSLFLGRDIAAGASILNEDSQRDTPLMRGARTDLPGWEARFAQTMALWNSARVRRLREALRVDELETG